MKKYRAAAAALFLVLFWGIDLYAVSTMKILVAEEKSAVYDYFYDAEDINGDPFVPGVFSGVPGLNVISKGLPGMQAHFIFNAGTFEQTAVMVDGIKVNDPQTGHYNFDLPFTVLDYGKFEIINSASSAAGSGGFSGLINIRTASYTGDRSMAAGGYGSHNTYFSAGSVSKRMGSYDLILSGEKRGSAGYHKATDYDENRGMTKIISKWFRLTAAISKKNYGAYDFYTPGAGLASREDITTMFYHLGTEPFENFTADFYTRGHEDYFIMNEDDPEYYSNTHSTYIMGGKAAYRMEAGKSLSLAANYAYDVDMITSSGLGDHTRHKNTGALNLFFTPGNAFIFNGNIAAEKAAENEAADFMPSASFKFEISQDFSVDAGYAYAVRYPNYTELYYNDPYNSGNSALLPEKTHSIKGGMLIKTGDTETKLSGFYKYNYELIDWGKDNKEDTAWQALNIGEIRTAGASAAAEFSIDPVHIRVSYTYLDSYRSQDYISKYGLTYLRNSLYTEAVYGSNDVGLKGSYEYKKYINRPEAMHNFSLSITNQVNKNSKIILKAENLLNMYFEEIPGIPAAGRILSIAVFTSN